jgi:hypothetical protein
MGNSVVHAWRSIAGFVPIPCLQSPSECQMFDSISDPTAICPDVTLMLLAA